MLQKQDIFYIFKSLSVYLIFYCIVKFFHGVYISSWLRCVCVFACVAFKVTCKNVVVNCFGNPYYTDLKCLKF